MIAMFVAAAFIAGARIGGRGRSDGGGRTVQPSR
jgi:hypothetical protein